MALGRIDPAKGDGKGRNGGGRNAPARRRRKEHVLGWLFLTNGVGLVGSVVYGGWVLTQAWIPWYAIGAFLAYFLGLLSPVLRETMGVREDYIPIVEKHRDGRHRQPPPAQEVFSNRHENILDRIAPVPVRGAFLFCLIGCGLIAADVWGFLTR